MKILNDQVDHYLCYYTLVVDSYSRFCDVGCVYCYAYDFSPEQRGNVDLEDLRSRFEKAFRENDSSYFSQILRKKIPFRLGFETDPFQGQEKSQKVTKALLEIFNEYEYPHIIFTKSTLILEKEYLDLLNPQLAYVQVSISSTDLESAQKVERNAPSPTERVRIVRTLNEKGIDAAIRFNILPNSLRDISEREYLDKVFLFLKEASVKKIILNEIHYRKNETEDVTHLEQGLFRQWMNDLQDNDCQLSYCYLGGASSRFFEFENPKCENCCQCDLSPANTRNSISISESARQFEAPKSFIHMFHLFLLKSLMSLVKKASK